MGLGQVALGIASLVMGVNHLRNGARQLSALDGLAGGGRIPSNPRRTGRINPRETGNFSLGMTPVNIRVPGRPFANTGHKTVSTPRGNRVMRMRSYNIRTLDDRIAVLQKLADAGKRDPEVYAFVRRAIGKKCGGKWCIPEKDNLGEARAVFGALRRAQPPRYTRSDIVNAQGIFKGLRRDVRYTSDISGVDTYQRPSHTLALGSGDCDDSSSTTCAALGAIGIPCRYKVIRTKGAKDWNHIYAQAGFPRANPQRWISMDSSVNMPFGWEAPQRMVAASRVFRVDNRRIKR